MRGNEKGLPDDERQAIKAFQIPMRGNEDAFIEDLGGREASFKSP